MNNFDILKCWPIYFVEKTWRNSSYGYGTIYRSIVEHPNWAGHSGLPGSGSVECSTGEWPGSHWFDELRWLGLTLYYTLHFLELLTNRFTKSHTPDQQPKTHSLLAILVF